MFLSAGDGMNAFTVCVLVGKPGLVIKKRILSYTSPSHPPSPSRQPKARWVAQTELHNLKSL